MNRKRFYFIVIGIIIILHNVPDSFAKVKKITEKRKTREVEILLTNEEAFNFIFPDVKEINKEKFIIPPAEWKELAAMMKAKYKVKMHKEYDKELNFYVGISKKGVISHYAYIDVVHGKWEPITYILGITPDGKVKDLAVMRYSERRGKPIKKRKFLDQFVGKRSTDQLILKRNIHAVSGATISSRSITNGIKKVLVLFEYFILNQRSENKISREIITSNILGNN